MAIETLEIQLSSKIDFLLDTTKRSFISRWLFERRLKKVCKELHITNAMDLLIAELQQTLAQDEPTRLLMSQFESDEAARQLKGQYDSHKTVALVIYERILKTCTQLGYGAEPYFTFQAEPNPFKVKRIIGPKGAEHAVTLNSTLHQKIQNTASVFFGDPLQNYVTNEHYQFKVDQGGLGITDYLSLGVFAASRLAMLYAAIRYKAIDNYHTNHQTSRLKKSQLALAKYVTVGFFALTRILRFALTGLLMLPTLPLLVIIHAASTLHRKYLENKAGNLTVDITNDSVDGCQPQLAPGLVSLKDLHKRLGVTGESLRLKHFDTAAANTVLYKFEGQNASVDMTSPSTKQKNSFDALVKLDGYEVATGMENRRRRFLQQL